MVRSVFWATVLIGMLVIPPTVPALEENPIPDVGPYLPEELRPVPFSPYPIDRTPIEAWRLEYGEPMTTPSAGVNRELPSGGVGIQVADYFAHVGVYAEYVTANKYTTGQATNIQTVIPQSLPGGIVYNWVSQTIRPSNVFLQVGYYVSVTDPTTAHPFYAVLPPGAGCGTGGGVCELKSAINLATGSWHQFWQASGVDGDPNKWGFYMDSWSNRIGVYQATQSNSGDEVPYTVMEAAAAGADAAQGPNIVTSPTEFYYAIQVLKNNAWSIPANGYKYHGHSYTCTQLGIVTFVQDARVRMGGNGPCPGQPYGTQMW